MAGHSPYVCGLDEFAAKKALDELNEDPRNRQGAIDTFRDWVVQQKHLKCPTDNKFLLAFLRARYFSQLEARQLLERFLKRRTKLSSWYHDLDIGAPEMVKVFKTGACLILPGRDKEGRKVFILRPGYLFDAKNFSKLESYRLMTAVMEYLYMCDETTQVHGTVTVIDLSRYTLAHETKMPLDERRKIVQTWQNNYPARIKAFHIYNAGLLVDIAMAFVKLAMNDKVQKRLVVHGRSLESLYKHIPREMLPDEYLDDDYDGPSAGSEQSIIENMLAEFSKPEVRERLLYLSSKEFTINMKEKDTMVHSASFRKLSVD